MAERLERLKVHRRAVVLDGHTHTVLSPRPGASYSFATNYFHETWHIVTDTPGARLLGRLFWAMAFQRRERTLMVIDQSYIVPDPFDADPSSPIAILNNDLGPLGRSAAGDLRAALPFKTPSDGTVVLQTRGLDAALADREAFEERETKAGWPWNDRQQRSWIDAINGLVVVAAPAPVLRQWGVDVSRTGGQFYEGSDEEELDWPRKRDEIQVLEKFHERLKSARAKRETLFPGRAHEALSDDEHRLLWGIEKAD
ncbi:MAG: hypothetical protein ACLPYW_02515 [Acidimicrobiales bacterium]